MTTLTTHQNDIPLSLLPGGGRLQRPTRPRTLQLSFPPAPDSPDSDHTSPVKGPDHTSPAKMIATSLERYQKNKPSPDFTAFTKFMNEESRSAEKEFRRKGRRLNIPSPQNDQPIPRRREETFGCCPQRVELHWETTQTRRPRKDFQPKGIKRVEQGMLERLMDFKPEARMRVLMGKNRDSAVMPGPLRGCEAPRISRMFRWPIDLDNAEIQ